MKEGKQATIEAKEIDMLKDGKMSDWSKLAFWEVALLHDIDWKGKWLNDGKFMPGHDEEFYADDPAPCRVPCEFTDAKGLRLVNADSN